MAIKRSVNISNNPNMGPAFRFREYSQSDYDAKGPYYNDSVIDFVTYHGNLYVCVNNGALYQSGNPTENGFLLLVEKGADGRPGADGARGPAGETPQYTLRFDGKQLTIINSVTNQREAVSPDLTGPSWFPELHDKQIVWVKKEADDLTAPNNINLEELRPIEERPILFRVDSDNTKRPDEESGPGMYIQWKREGNESWTNLISLSELMNIALAGVCFWWDPAEDGSSERKLHFGHRQVVKATYDSSKTGNRKIADVVLGEVLFDAGEVPFKNYDEQIADIEALLCGINEVDFSGLVKSISVNNNAQMRPDENGNININIEPGIQNLTLYTRDESGETWLYYAVEKNGVETERRLFKVPTSGNGNISVINYYSAGQNNNKIATINGVDIYAPAGSGNGGIQTVNLDLQLGGQNGRTLQYRLSVDGNGSWQNGPELPAGGNADLSNLKLRIRTDNSTGKKYLEISRDGGNTWVEPLELPAGGGTTPDPNGEIDLSDYVLVSYLEANYFNQTQSDNRYLLRSELTGGLVSYRTFTIYQRTNSNTTVPNTPDTSVAATWDVTNGVLTLPSGYTQWTNHPENATSQKPYLWTTSATFRSTDGSRTTPWETPICVTGKDGDGVDGDGIEFIYHRGAQAPNIDTQKAYQSGQTTKDFGNNTTESHTWWASSDSRDWLPGDGTANGYWTDDPVGIEDTNDDTKIEWASVRTYDGVNETWGDFCAPFRWAMWGEDGIDGAGVEYIFYVGSTTNNTVIVDPQTGLATLNATVWRTQIPTANMSAQEFETFSNTYHYQIDDWCPDNTIREGYQMPDFNWTDNPSDVDFNQPYEFVCIRKKRYNPSTHQSEWGRFSEPKLWGYYGTTTVRVVEYGDTNQQPYLCYAFCRTTGDTDLSNYRVEYDFSAFGSSATTYADLTSAQKNLFYLHPQDYTKTMNGNTVVNGIVWSDTIPFTKGQLWVITNHIGDEDSNTDQGWTQPQKWGDQVGLQIEYANSESGTTDAVYAGTKTLISLNTLSNGNPKYETNDRSKDLDGDGIDETTWRQDVYNAGMGTWGDEDDIADPDYMAISFKRENGVWTNWQIARIKGEKGNPGNPGPAGADGADIEFIYYRTKTNSNPGCSQQNYKISGNNQTYSDGNLTDHDDVLPQVTNVSVDQYDDGNYWHDNPTGVTSEWQYEWMAYRLSYSNYNSSTHTYAKLWLPFTTPVVWSHFGKNGQDGDGVEYVFHLGNSGTVAPGLSTSAGRVYIGNGTYQDVTLSNNWTYNGTDYNPAHTSEFYPSDGQSGYWTDDPTGVSDADGHRFEWVSMRRYNGSDRTWGSFSTPALWSNFAEKGDDGTSVSIKGTYEYATDLVNLLGTANAPTIGDCYIILTGIINSNVSSSWTHVATQMQNANPTISNTYSHSHLWTYIVVDSNSANDTPTYLRGFRDLGEFANIDPNNLHMRFAEDYTGNSTTPTDSTAQVPVVVNGSTVNLWLTMLSAGTPGPYVGFYTGQQASNRIQDYTWSKWNGEDFLGLESIFIALPENATVVRPTLSLLSGTSGHNRISGFTYRDGTTINTVSMTNNSTTNQNYYSTFDYVPIVTTASGETQRWYDIPDAVLDNSTHKMVYYQCSRKLSAGMIEWSVPMVYRPVAQDGKDGRFEEFVYAYNDDPTTPPTMSSRVAWDKTLNNGSGGFKAHASGDGAKVFGWYDALPLISTANNSSGLPSSSSAKWIDNPTGVSNTVDGTCEWVSKRSITYENGNENPTFGPFETPTLRSHYGHDGVDGDGIEYVFFALTEAEHLVVQAHTFSVSGGITYNGKLQVSNTNVSGDSDHGDNSKSEFLPYSVAITNGYGTVSARRATDDNPGVSSQYPYIYVAIRTYDGETGNWNPFVYASCWTNSGIEGMDGDTDEYIYHCYANELTANQLNSSNPSYVIGSYGKTSTNSTVTNDTNKPDFLPADSQSSSPTTFWTDNPSGISELLPYEYVSKRSITHTRNNDGTITTTYGSFSTPVIWSKWGDKGRDGDGVEYIYCIVPANITSESNGVISLDSQFWPNNSWTYDNPGIITKTVNGSSVSVTWIDDPGTPTASTPYQFVSVRKYKYNSTTNTSAWDNWSEPSLWTRYTTGGTPGENAITVDLTNEMDALCVSPSSYTATRQYSFGTSFSLFDGQTELTSITAQVKTGTNTYSSSGSFLNNKVSVTMGTISGANRPKADIVVSQGADFTNYMSSGYEITFKISKGSIEKEVIYKLVPIPLESGSSWKIIPSANHVSVSYDASNNPTYLPNQLTCSAYRSYMDGETSVLDPISTFNSVNGPYNITYEITNLSGTTANPVNYSTAVSVADATYAFITFKLYYKLSSGFVLVDQETVPINRDGLNGINVVTYQSLEQPVMRITDWTGTGALTRYFNGSVVVDNNNAQAANNTPGVKYLDVVKYVVTENGVDSIYYYKCKVSVDYGNTSTFPNGKTGHSPKLDTSYWEMFTAANDAAMANLIVNNTAFINSLTSKQVVITDNSNNIVAGMASGSSSDVLAAAGINSNASGANAEDSSHNSVRIWAGTPTTTNDLTTAPFRVMSNGDLYASNATISGNVTANSINTISINGNAVDSNNQLKIVFSSASSINNPDQDTLYFLWG